MTKALWSWFLLHFDSRADPWFENETLAKFWVALSFFEFRIHAGQWRNVWFPNWLSPSLMTRPLNVRGDVSFNIWVPAATTKLLPILLIVSCFCSPVVPRLKDSLNKEKYANYRKRDKEYKKLSFQMRFKLVTSWSDLKPLELPPWPYSFKVPQNTG